MLTDVGLRQWTGTFVKTKIGNENEDFWFEKDIFAGRAGSVGNDCHGADGKRIGIYVEPTQLDV